MESFEDFKNSFSYGSRNDLTFKFLKKLPAEDAAEFFRLLLDEIGHTFDDGDLERIHRLVYHWQVRGYAPDPEVTPAFVYDDGPFTRLPKPLAECRVGLLTSSGQFVEGDDPEPFGVTGMTQEEASRRIDDFMRATPELSEIHRDTHADEIRVRHGGYDVRGAETDHNVTLPRDALVEAEMNGVIGEFADTMFSFVGATSQGRLRAKALPIWIERLRAERIDALVLVPV